MMGVHTSTIPVSKSVRDYRHEKRDQKKEDARTDQLREEQRYDKEKKAFTDKYRKKIAKENKKHPSARQRLTYLSHPRKYFIYCWQCGRDIPSGSFECVMMS